MIVVMIYNTIDQMRPAQIVVFIHQHVLRAREYEERLLGRTRRKPRRHWLLATTIRSPESGHIAAIKVDQIRVAVEACRPGTAELELLVPVGSRVAVGDPLFALRVDPHALLGPQDRERIAGAAVRALTFDDERDLRRDASYGLYQLATIAWSSTSTAKSNPHPG